MKSQSMLVVAAAAALLVASAGQGTVRTERSSGAVYTMSNATTSAIDSGSSGSGGGELFLASALSVDPVAKTVTLPMFKGTSRGQDVWYIVTESSDRADAERRGVSWSAKLANALVTSAVQKARLAGGVVDFPGTVDFSPTRVVVPGATGFPPDQAQPGAVGDAEYSPLVTTGNGIVLNAPHVANGSGRHDTIVSIDVARRRVTLSMLAGLYNDKDILYLRTDASIEVVSAIEGSTFAPNLNFAPGLASDDRETSAREAIIPIVNGPLGTGNPERQGLQSALFGEGDPLNITQTLPYSDRYSPMWDIHAGVWTDAAIAAGERRRLGTTSEIANAVQKGFLVSAGVGPANGRLGGLRALGAISNCPIVVLLP